MRTIGCIGGGNMASAIYEGILANGLANPSDIVVYDIDEAKLTANAARVGFVAASSNLEVVEKCDIIFLAVKPQFAAGVCELIRPMITKEKAFVSIMAGWTNERLHEHLGKHARILRVMPNTPLMVGAGMSCLCSENDFSEEEFDWVQSVFGALGRCVVLEEKQIATFASIAGSSPAYVFMFIEAMADAGCLLGLPRPLCYETISQAVLGSGKLALESGQHPAQLKDAVCSPGGTTIVGVNALEQGGFRSAIIDAIIKCTEKFNTL